jgi:apolipoprotein N-acyltransferase
VPQHRAGAVELPLPPALPSTLFARYGNILAFAVAGLMILTAIAIRRRAR